MSGAQNPKEIVRTGYDSLSLLYRKDTDSPPNHVAWTQLLISNLPQPPATVLDLGCGCGVPVAQMLANEGHAITGVDISAVQIERAKILVPQGTFIQADIASPALADRFLQTKFDAIIALYVFIHVPVEEQQELMHRLAGWMKVGGYCAITTGITPWSGEQGGWLGAEDSVKMWWAQVGVDEYREWIKDAGFEILRDEPVPEEGNEGHQFFFLEKVAKTVVV